VGTPHAIKRRRNVSQNRRRVIAGLGKSPRPAWDFRLRARPRDVRLESSTPAHAEPLLNLLELAIGPVLRDAQRARFLGDVGRAIFPGFG
jgi:hypothetical protein